MLKYEHSFCFCCFVDNIIKKERVRRDRTKNGFPQPKSKAEPQRTDIGEHNAQYSGTGYCKLCNYGICHAVVGKQYSA